MEALVVTPGEAGSARVADVPAARPEPGQVTLRTLEVGVCGTDREISDGLFGRAPEGDDHLILGHELLGEVVEDLVSVAVRLRRPRSVRWRCGPPARAERERSDERLR